MDTATTTTEAPEINIPLRALEKKDEQGNLIVALNPVIATILRGEAKGNPYPVIKVTPQTVNDYIKFRGLDNVLADINAIEAQRAQGALDYVLNKFYPNNADGESEAWEETDPDPDTKKPRWKVVASKFLAVLDDFYKTLTEGKVRSGETIESLNLDKAAFLEEMNAALASVRTVKDPQKVAAIMMEASDASMKFQECEAKIAEIRKNRAPRMTKAEKAAAVAAAKAKEAAAPAVAA